MRSLKKIGCNLQEKQHFEYCTFRKIDNAPNNPKKTLSDIRWKVPHICRTIPRASHISPQSRSTISRFPYHWGFWFPHMNIGEFGIFTQNKALKVTQTQIEKIPNHSEENSGQIWNLWLCRRSRVLKCSLPLYWVPSYWKKKIIKISIQFSEFQNPPNWFCKDHWDETSRTGGFDLKQE